MALNLDGSYAKLDWAEQHLHELQRETGVWISAQPLRMRSEFYPEANVLVGRLLIPVPLAWSVMAGNVLHNARSALDYLVGRLVRKVGNVPKTGPGGNQFPIFDWEPHGGFDKKVRGGYLSGVAPADRTAIERLQPYHGRNDPAPPPNPLSDLGNLSNVDKHQDLVVAFLNPMPNEAFTGRLRFDKGVREVIEAHFARFRRLEDGAVFAWAEIVPDPATEPKMYVEGRVTLHVGLDDGRNLGATLGNIVLSTRAVIDAFAAGRPDLLKLREEELPVVPVG